MQQLTLKNEATVQEQKAQLREAKERIEELELQVFANDNASKTFDQKSREFRAEIAQLEAAAREKDRVLADAKTNQIAQAQKLNDVEADLARKVRDLEDVTKERDLLARESQEKKDAMTESLLTNNNQARQLWEDKLKDLQRQNVKLEQTFKDKDRLIADLNSQVERFKEQVRDMED